MEGVGLDGNWGGLGGEYSCVEGVSEGGVSGGGFPSLPGDDSTSTSFLGEASSLPVVPTAGEGGDLLLGSSSSLDVDSTFAHFEMGHFDIDHFENEGIHMDSPSLSKLLCPPSVMTHIGRGVGLVLIYIE